MSASPVRHDNSWWQIHPQRIEQEGICTKAYADREGLSARQLYDKCKELKRLAAQAPTQHGAAQPGTASQIWSMRIISRAHG